jgi:hypothetical protein
MSSVALERRSKGYSGNEENVALITHFLLSVEPYNPTSTPTPQRDVESSQPRPVVDTPAVHDEL